MKMVFIQIDWMKYYVGEGDEEKAIPQCGYNFQHINGYYYGYGEGMEELAIEQLEGVSKEDPQVDNVLVVWVSKDKSGESKIVGWYKDAALYKEAIYKLTVESERAIMCYSAKAKAEGCLLLPMEERQYTVEAPNEIMFELGDKTEAAKIYSYIHNYAGDKMNFLLTPEQLEATMSLDLSFEEYFYKADQFLARDAYHKAIRCFNRAIKEEPELTLGYEAKASVLLSIKMYDEAIKLYHTVIEKDQDADLAYYCLGLLYGLTEQYSESLNYFNEYLLRRPNEAQALAERAVVNYHLKEIEQAKRDIKKAVKKESDNPIMQQIFEVIMGE